MLAYTQACKYNLHLVNSGGHVPQFYVYYYILISQATIQIDISNDSD